jgi:outer membrane protein assembly factor BamB
MSEKIPLSVLRHPSVEQQLAGTARPSEPPSAARHPYRKALGRMLFAAIVILLPTLPAADVFHASKKKKLHTPRAKRHRHLRLKWKVRIGKTHFRHSILSIAGKVIVASNGATFAGHGEKDDAVYVIDGKRGKIVRRIRPQTSGDSDINGVASDGTHLYFGSDDNQLFKYTIDGKKLLAVQVDGDVEGTPALADFNGDKVYDIAIGTEAGSVYAIDGKSGKVLWKKGTSAAATYGSRGIMASPAVGDLNGDGIEDVIIGARDNDMRAFNGRTGAQLWSYHTNSGIHASVTLRDFNGDRVLDVLGATSYSDVFILDGKTGRVVWKESLTHHGGGIEGLFSSPVVLDYSRKRHCVLIGTAWWDQHEGFYCAGSARSWTFRIPKHKISSSAAVADILPGGGMEVIFGAENGALYVLDSRGRLKARIPTKGAIEATPAVYDIDGDGKLELLVASQDGFLYAFDTRSKGPVQRATFRADARGSGQQPKRFSLQGWLKNRGRSTKR